MASSLKLWTLTLAVAITAMGSANADSKTYVNVTGDFGYTPNNCDESLPISQGGVCFPAGHITPDAEGTATITVTDNLLNPVSALHCEDQNLDAVCETEREPGEWFCGTHTIRTDEDWDLSANVLIIIDGPVFGNPVTSVCATLSASTFGVVDHT